MEYQTGDVVELLRVADKLSHCLEHRLSSLLGILGRTRREDMMHTLNVELFPFGIHRFGDAVRIENNGITRFQVDRVT